MIQMLKFVVTLLIFASFNGLGMTHFWPMYRWRFLWNEWWSHLRRELWPWKQTLLLGWKENNEDFSFRKFFISDFFIFTVNIEDIFLLEVNICLSDKSSRLFLSSWHVHPNPLRGLDSFSLVAGRYQKENPRSKVTHTTLSPPSKTILGQTASKRRPLDGIPSVTSK